MHKKSRATRTFAMILGNVFEHYDMALFGLLSPFIAPLFFPNQSYELALIMTYTLIPIGMLSRPIGALFFGYIGDHYGREKALVISLTGMAVFSVALGCLPTYQQVGIAAPILLSVIRVSQNFFSSGEVIGGAIYVLENTQEGKKDLFSGIFGSSTVLGIVLASLFVTFLTRFGIENLWRWLYLLGGATAVFAVILRKHHLKAPDINLSLSSSKALMLSEILNVLWQYRKEVVMIATAAGFSYCCYTVSLILTNGFIPLISAHTKEEMVMLNSVLLIADLMMLPFFASLAHIFPRQKIMRAATAAVILIAAPLFFLLEDASLITVIAIRLTFVCLGVWFCATFHSWSQSLVPKKVRYLVISFSYAIGTKIFGAPTAALSLWMYHTTGYVASASFYWIILAFITAAALSLKPYDSYSKVLTTQQST